MKNNIEHTIQKITQEMVWSREHSPHFNYSGHGGSPHNMFSYSPFFKSHPIRKLRKEVREAESREESLRTAIYVGAGTLGIVGVGALIWMAAKKSSSPSGYGPY